MPIVGRVMEAAGIVLIDRQDTAAAIEEMTALVDVMRVEGKSVAMSPEGTRAISPKLAQFKKGAFHLAMQAGVPIVPIVIHNSVDVQPKGDMLYHPGTVEVEVLPPVETNTWTVDTINEHVADVRLLYLEALGQVAHPNVVEFAEKRQPTESKIRAERKTRESGDSVARSD